MVYCQYDKHNLKPIINCFQTYQLNKLLECYHGTEIEIQDQDGRCIIIGLMEINQIQAETCYQLDTGSDCDIISITKLNEMFPGMKFKFQQTQSQLIGANSQKIKVLGTLAIKCHIGTKTLILTFYVILPGNVILLSWNSIKAFNLIIDTASNRIKTVNSIERHPLDRILEHNICNDNAYIIFTPVFDLFDMRTHYITLKPTLNKFNQTLLYTYISIYRCNCRANGYVLCSKCLTVGPHITLFFNGQQFDIIFHNKENIELPENYIFQGVKYLERTHQIKSNLKVKSKGNESYWWDNEMFYDDDESSSSSSSSSCTNHINGQESVYNVESTVSLNDIITHDNEYDVEPGTWELKGEITQSMILIYNKL